MQRISHVADKYHPCPKFRSGSGGREIEKFWAPAISSAYPDTETLRSSHTQLQRIASSNTTLQDTLSQAGSQCQVSTLTPSESAQRNQMLHSPTSTYARRNTRPQTPAQSKPEQAKAGTATEPSFCPCGFIRFDPPVGHTSTCNWLSST